MMRPVINLFENKIEYIGTFEQVYLDICISRDEEYQGLTTHMEISKTSFLSNLANLIPMPDCNQSPRYVYLFILIFLLYNDSMVILETCTNVK